MADLARGLLKLSGLEPWPRRATPRLFVKSTFGDPDRIRTGDLCLDMVEYSPSYHRRSGAALRKGWWSTAAERQYFQLGRRCAILAP